MLERNLVERAFQEHSQTIASLSPLLDQIAGLGILLRDTLKKGSKILWMGNGGSAADCQHLAAEIVGRYIKERKGLPSLALTTDTSILTAVGNDYGFDHVFSRQIEALCAPGDVVVGISTSGNSANVVRGIEAALEIGATTIAFTGESGGRLAEICHHTLRVPSRTTARIQEAHILVGHILCECIDADI